MRFYNLMEEPVLLRPVEPRLQASIRVMDELVGAPSLAKRHLQGIGGELACEGASDLPPDDHP
jgi:hypothetical protein